MSLSEGGVEVYSVGGNVVSIESLNINGNFVVDQFDGNNGYLQYWQIPVNALSENVSFDGQNFRFDIQLVNNNGSGSKTGALFWNSNAGDQWRCVQNQGYVLMSGKTISTVSNNKLVFGATSNLEDTVYITGDDVFAITANESWVHFSEDTYNGKRGLRVWIDKNTAAAGRQSTISLVNADYELTISVMQGPLVKATLSKHDLVFGATSNLEDTVYITGNDVFAITANESWVHFSEGTYSGKRGLRVWVDRNTNYSTRQDTITLVATDYSLTIPVWQEGYVGVSWTRSSNLIYPNPASDQLTIISKGSHINWIRLMDLNGREISALKIHNRQANLDIHQLKPGIYLITVIQSDGSVMQQKFQKK